MIKNIILFIPIFILVVLCTNSLGIDDVVEGNAEKFTGTWISENTVCQVDIKTIGSYIEISVTDTSKLNYTINVSNIYLDGEILKFDTFCLENSWYAKNSFRVINDCVLENELSTTSKKLIFRKKQCQKKNLM
jgi:hypothetical protein